MPASDKTLPAFTAYHCAPKPWSEPTNVVGSQHASSRAELDCLVRLVVRGADVSLADRDPTVGDVVVREVVVVRVRVAVHIRRRDQPHELVLELVSGRTADHQELRRVVERLQDVAEVLEVSVLPLQTLFDVGVLVDDQRLERREVGRRGRREVVRELLLESGRAGRAEGVVRRVDARDRREVDAELREVRCDLDCLRVEAGRLPARAPVSVTFTSAQSPALRSAAFCEPSLPAVEGARSTRL